MNFDDLSARWQQQVAPLPIGAQLPGPAHSPIRLMRRNLWAEIAASLFFGLLVLAALRLAYTPRLAGLVLGLVALYALLATCYVWALRLLQGLRRSSEALSVHLGQQLQQLRQLLRLYYGSAMLAALGCLALGGYAAQAYVLPAMGAAHAGQFMVWFALTAAVSLALTHWLTRFHLRRAYGRHLDHLEETLHELREGSSRA